MNTYIFDIETNGLLLEVDTFHCGVVYHIEKDTHYTFTDANELIDMLLGASRIVGHNIIGYDIPALEIVSSRCLKTLYTIAYDTYLASKLLYYDKDRSFLHSLRSWGDRFNFPKGTHEDWSKLSDEMIVYCKQDVDVTTKIYNYFTTEPKHNWLKFETLDIEQQVQRIITKQYIDGWLFDNKKGEQLHVELVGDYEDSLRVLQETFKPLFLPKGKISVPKKPFKRLGVTTLGANQPITLSSFNPGSSEHIVWWVNYLYGEQPWVRTEKGNIKTDSDTLFEMFSDTNWAKPLLHYLEVKKLLGQLAEGDKAWLKSIHKDGRIHGQADILGAVTGRFTHSNPNLAQVPSVRAFKGKEARSLFTVSKGYKLIGCDASGLELRTLSHYLAKYDDGVYGKIVVDGDIHTANQQAAGLPTRDNAKTFILTACYT